MASATPPNTGSLPRYADTVVVGGGTAGSALAGTLAQAEDGTVLVLEAGPDYGRFDPEVWPDDLLNSRTLPSSHSWGLDSALTYPDRVLAFERARVIGGCSSHNGCAAIVGSALDYDAWEAGGCTGWGALQLKPLFVDALKRLRVRQPTEAEGTPFQLACLEAAPAVGVPQTADLNNWDEDIGIALSPVNVVDGVRWNAAFAYLDPVRDSPSVTIVGNATVVRLVTRGVRVVAVEVVSDGAIVEVACGRVVVAAGTYGSPVILERSGIGDPDLLRSRGVVPTHKLCGVGRNLHDHPAATVKFAGGHGSAKAMTRFAASHPLPEEQSIAKLRSQYCRAGFDLHIYPIGGPSPDGWRWELPVAYLTPVSRGEIHISSASIGGKPVIDHRFLADPNGTDARILADGVRIVRDLAAQQPLKDVLGAELNPLAAHELVRQRVEHYYHPVGSCRMGPVSDPDAVVDPAGRLHGLDNAFVADCSICPTAPRANTNLPAAVVGLRVAQTLMSGDLGERPA